MIDVYAWLAKNIAKVIAIVLVIALIAAAFAVRSCSRERAARDSAAVSASQASAATASGVDAVGVVGNRAAADAAIDETTRTNDDAIRNATGADQPVDPAAGAAGLHALCTRTAYRHDPRCVQ